MTDYINNGPGEYSTVTIWTPNGHPGINDTINVKYKVTITDTEEYIRRCIIENGGGELEINAVAADSGLVIQNATFMRLEIEQSLTTPGILDMNGTSDYTAYVRPENTAVTHGLASLFYGQINMLYAEIAGFWFSTLVASEETNRIECDNMILTMDNSKIESVGQYPFYFHGAPDSDSPPTMTHSELRNMWPAIFYDSNNFFFWSEFYKNRTEELEPVQVQHAILGRDKGRTHQTGMYAKELEIIGSFHDPANRWKMEDLKALGKKNYKWWLFMSEEIFQAVWLGPISDHSPPGSRYRHDFSVEFTDTDAD